MKRILLLIVSITSILSATQLFERCGTCHGKKGEKHSLNLTKPIAGMKAEDVAKIMKEYKAGTRNTYGFGTMMKGQASKLSDEDIKTIAAYIESLPPVEIVLKPKEETEVSPEKIFQKCAVCHGKKGEKRSLDVSKTIAGMKAEDVIKILEQYRVGKRDIYSYGNMMRGQATKLSHEKIKIIAKYIESLPPVVDTSKSVKPARKITQEEIDYNSFMDAYFRDSTNPNETFEAAKKKYQEHKQKLKEKNE
ncbi:MAG: c-type cytochrome [Sulfurimonas sp.]|uniref:c-type cytochrome n=1 Tax=Sulfurimonas sp. TaxID=2022749 RepID=UPI0026193948|nr:c-type cytochrome [Sulfurimonas sp.]MCW8895592.1 c-type cytochrome [Sulfurimonas sp.]MCW8954763.1 c-type cytochrome [Sulfurimonas sp.]MCW9067601.1 c-type cytochrome [Sulfurimonas sp.]